MFSPQTYSFPKILNSYYNYISYDGMTYKTINLTPDTYEKLIMFKHGNMSFNDIINEMMDIIGEEDFYKHVLKEHKNRMNKIKAGEFIETDDLDSALNDT